MFANDWPDGCTLILNFFYYTKNFNFWHNMLYSAISIVISDMSLFVHWNEYRPTQLYDFACVCTCDRKAKITYSVTKKFIASIR